MSGLAVRQAGEPVARTMAAGWLLAADGGFRRLTPDGQLRALMDITGGGRCPAPDLSRRL